MKLVIISDTPIYRSKNNLEILEPPLREIESISSYFEEIVWIGYYYDKYIYNTKVPISKNINLIGLENSGGDKSIDKLKVLLKIPVYFRVILSYMKKADMIHLRSPSVPSMIAMILNFFLKIEKGWIKYAGSWTGKTSKSYTIQRAIIKNHHLLNSIILSKDTKSEKLHFLLNPCFYKKDILNNILINGKKQKNIFKQINIIFVGSLDSNKRPNLLVDVIKDLHDFDILGSVYFFGAGPLSEYIIQAAQKYEKIKFMGVCSRDKIDKYYLKSSILVLPSKSEGFPKVIAEGALHGCVPITTDLEGIKTVIEHNKNGFLLKNDQNLKIKLSELLIEIFKNPKKLEFMMLNLSIELEKFTYENFSEKILKISRYFD